MQRKRQKSLVARGLKALLALVTTCIAGGEACAGEIWNGSNLTIYGSSDPTDVYVKRLDGETLSAGWIKIGTELGCASLVAVDSTITLSDKLYIGWEQSPGYTNTAGSTAAQLTASLGFEHFIAVDGKLVTYFADAAVPAPSRPGYFGFGIFESHAEFTRLKVYRPHPTPRPLAYLPGSKVGR